ncbi:proton-coupled folate transporter [Lingula anatina]|uniref:Proton-coupled folate transporter n=1 Tax=Lingula anatina TaxID=7574 RepID=A0A1S3JUK6_LINAN|nr:proton-coupled folate transporter [Lingula anatina]|eukprot:XP_013413774.1 proton-coupled folate transporter [Lingula anatina]
MALKKWWMDHKHDMRLVITIEPATFLYILSLYCSWPAAQALYIEKVCMGKYKSEEICSNLTFHDVERDYVQTESSRWFFYSICLETFPSMIAASFMGSWGDQINRKIPIVIPIIGLLIMHSNFLLNSIFIDWHPAFVLISYFSSGILGGIATFLLSAYSYVAVVSKGNKERLVRISVTEGVLQLAGAIGLGISGLLVENFGFPATFGVSTSSAAVALIYTLLWIKNPISTESKEQEAMSKQERNLCARLFDCNHFIDSMKCFFVKREEYRRLILWLSLITLILTNLTIGAAMTLTLLFLRYVVPGWNLTLYGIYAALKNVMMMIALFLFMPVVKKLALDDTTVAIVGHVSAILGVVLLAFSRFIWMAMLVPFANMLSAFSSTALRAVVARMVGKHEQGKAFAFVGSAQSLSVLLSSVIFNNLYPETLHFFPGLSYLLCAVLLLVAIVLTIIIRFRMPKPEVNDTMNSTATLDKSVSAIAMNEVITDVEQYPPISGDGNGDKSANCDEVNGISAKVVSEEDARRAEELKEKANEFFKTAMTLTLLFLRYVVPGWNLTLYGIYAALKNVMMMIALFLFMPVVKKLALDDTTVAIVGHVSAILGVVLLAFSRFIWMAMLVPFANMLSAFSSTALRAVVARMVGKHEQGKAFAFVGSAQSLSVLLSSVIFNNLYPETLHFFPGLSYLLCAVLLLVAIVLTIIIRFRMPKPEVNDTMNSTATLDKSVSAIAMNEVITDVEQYPV